MHSLVIGTTGSGKTTLIKSLCRDLCTKTPRRDVIVYDPIKPNPDLDGPTWHLATVCTTQNEFLRYFHASKNCMVVVDEAGATVGQHNEPMIQTATQGRHYGHDCIYITQRCKQITPTVRDNCGQLFLFATSPKDCKELVEDWNEPSLTAAADFNVFEFLHMRRLHRPVHRRLHNPPGVDPSDS